MPNGDRWEWAWFWIAICVLAVAFWKDIWYSRLAYKLYYSVDDSKLSIERKPHDCDFWKAPIGEKDCHYKRTVSAIEIGKDPTDKKPVMSFDGGKTWSYFTPDPGTYVPRDLTVTSVSVTWDKVED